MPVRSAVSQDAGLGHEGPAALGLESHLVGPRRLLSGAIIQPWVEGKAKVHVCAWGWGMSLLGTAPFETKMTAECPLGPPWLLTTPPASPADFTIAVCHALNPKHCKTGTQL